MNKEYKTSNNSYREHFKLHGYLSPTTIADLLQEYEALECKVTALEHDEDEIQNELDYWRNKYESLA